MTRGTILFICTQCKKVFLAPDIEYGAMFFSVPMPCERCGSIRTLRWNDNYVITQCTRISGESRAQIRIWGKIRLTSNTASGWNIWMTAFMVLMSLFIG